MWVSPGASTGAKRSGRMSLRTPCRPAVCILLFRLIGIRGILVWRLRMGRHGGERRRADCRQLRGLVFRGADIAMDQVFLDAVHDHLNRLGLIFRVEPNRLIEIDVLLGELIVVDHHLHVVVLVFRIRPAQREGERPDALELLRLCQVEFEITSLSALRERDHSSCVLAIDPLRSSRVALRFPSRSVRFLATSSCVWLNSFCCSSSRARSSLSCLLLLVPLADFAPGVPACPADAFFSAAASAAAWCAADISFSFAVNVVSCPCISLMVAFAADS